MRSLFSVIALVGAVVVFEQRANADLYVVQVGDGAITVNNNSSSFATFVKQFDDTGTFLNTINMPTAVVDTNRAFTLSGSGTTEGHLALSTNGQYLTLGGFDAAPGTATIGQTASAVVNRVLARIDISVPAPVVDTTTALTDAFNAATANNAPIRSVVTNDGTSFWATGTSQGTGQTVTAGVRYAAYGATTSTQLSTAPTNVRVVTIFDNQLYISTMSNPYVGVSTVGESGPPTTEGQTTALLPGMDPDADPTPSPYGMWFKDASTLYIADDRSESNGGGIEKWTLDSGTWSYAYTLKLGTGSGFGARGLTGTIVGGNAVLFATTTNTSANRIMTITDTGVSSVASQFAQAPMNTIFRGLAYVPTSVDPPDELTGDYNGDQIVDAADYVLWRDSLDSMADLNGDLIGGTIGDGQYQQWRENFGATPPGSGNVGVPEPSGVALLLMGIAAAVLWRRQ